MYKDLERIKNFNLQQMVTTPTRQENILDIFLTNTPSLVQNTETLPSLGMSVYDIVFHELPNWEDFKTDLSEFAKTFINSDQTDPNLTDLTSLRILYTGMESTSQERHRYA